MRALSAIGIAITAALLTAPAQIDAQTKRESFPSLAHEFVYTTLAFSPAGAMQSGLHTWRDPRTGRSLNFDQMLDDFSPASIAMQRDYYSKFRTRLETIGRANLDAQTRADYDLLLNAVDFGLFNIDEERFYEWRPQMYSEDLG